MAKVTLDMETFKALASETRLGVLRALDERRKTLTELARELELNKATVHEHLQLLTATGLVKKRDDEGRKWIYYELTWSGERILHPQETTTFAVLLGIAVAAAGGGVTLLGRAAGWWLQERQVMQQGGPETAAAPTDQADSAPPDSSQLTAPAPDDGMDMGDFWDDGGLLAILLLVTSLALVAIGWFVRRHRRPGAESHRL